MGEVGDWIELILINDERVALLTWEPVQSTLLVLGLLLTGTINSISKCLIINFVLKYAPKNRPLNTITLIDQAIQLTLSSMFTLGIVFPIMTEAPLHHYLGNAGCFALWFSVTVHNCCVTCGAFVMALFRAATIYLRDSARSQNLRKKATGPIMIACEWILIAFFYPLLWIAKENSGSSLAIQFCNGHSSIMETVIMRYEGILDETIAYGLLMVKVAFLLVQVMVAAELIIYVFMFRYLREHNRSMAATVSHEELRRRHKGNVINLTGQALSCLVSSLTLTGWVIMMKVDNNRFFSPPATNCFYVLAFAMSSLSFFAGSPELRRTYFK